jgi:predicted house-cleaning noncanonical NTP pyrophosphatase (MazG superfamily)
MKERKVIFMSFTYFDLSIERLVKLREEFEEQLAQAQEEKLSTLVTHYIGVIEGIDRSIASLQFTKLQYMKDMYEGGVE